MPAEIGYRDIQVAPEDIGLAWHGLTTLVPGEITADNCGILYEMTKQPLFLPDGKATPHFGIVSMDDGKMVGNPVSGRYSIISNRMIWDSVIEAMNGTAHRMVSVGTCSDRERGYISVKLSDEFMAAERKTMSTLNILWGHGGCMNVIARVGFTVVVCRNTYNAALSEKNGDFAFRIKHVGDVKIQLDGMRDAIEKYWNTVAAFKQAMDTLHAQPMVKDDASKMFAGFIVDKVDDEIEVSARAKNQYEELTFLFSKGKGNKGETAADAFNAGTQFYTHGAATSELAAIKQFETSEFGTGQDRKEELLTVLLGQKARRVGTYEDCVKRGALVLSAA